MTHYHPISFETEGRIRQGQKLERARRHRHLAATAARPRPQPGVSLFDRLHGVLSTVVAKTTGKRPSMKSPA